METMERKEPTYDVSFFSHGEKGQEYTPPEERMLLAVMPLKCNGEEVDRIVSASEAMLIEELLEQNELRSLGVPFENDLLKLKMDLVDDELSAPFIVYGAVAPQYGANVWDNKEVYRILDSLKETYLQTVHLRSEKGALASFAFHDYTCEFDAMVSDYVPCAFLMFASEDYPTIARRECESDNFLGIAISPAYKGNSVVDNILNRDCVIIIRDIEPAFAGDLHQWKDCVKKTMLQKAATFC